MRILIGYDGSESSTAALAEQRYAGLPRNAEVIVLTVNETNTNETPDEAAKISSAGRATLGGAFPNWKINAEVATGRPADEIIRRAASFLPDLIAVSEPQQMGNNNKSNMSGSAKTLLTEAKCSVRVAKQCSCVAPDSRRILVGFNGSTGALRAVESIASRSWPVGTEVRLLAVADSAVLGSIGRFTPQMNDVAVETKFTLQWAETLAAGSLEKLFQAGIRSHTTVRLGDPREVIANEARIWKAGNIFLGAHCSGDLFVRTLLGSVSAAVAASAPCSVEVVRHGESKVTSRG